MLKIAAFCHITHPPVLFFPKPPALGQSSHKRISCHPVPLGGCVYTTGEAPLFSIYPLPLEKEGGQGDGFH